MSFPTVEFQQIEKALGEQGRKRIPVIINKIRGNENPVELYELIQAFWHFKEPVPEAIPLLVDLTTYYRDASPEEWPNSEIKPWLVRQQAIVALQHMKINTPEVRLALEEAVRLDSKTSSQAAYALKVLDGD